MAIQHGLIKTRRIDTTSWRMNSHIKRLFQEYANEPNSDYVILDYEQLKAIYNRLAKAIKNKNIEYICNHTDFLKDYEWDDIDAVHVDLKDLLNISDPQSDIFIYWVA